MARADRRAYSYDAPSHGGSWKKHILEELGAFKGKERCILRDYLHIRITALCCGEVHCTATSRGLRNQLEPV